MTAPDVIRRKGKPGVAPGTEIRMPRGFLKVVRCVDGRSSRCELKFAVWVLKESDTPRIHRCAACAAAWLQREIEAGRRPAIVVHTPDEAPAPASDTAIEVFYSPKWEPAGTQRPVRLTVEEWARLPGDLKYRYERIQVPTS